MITDKLKKEIEEAVKRLQKDCKCDFDIPNVELEHPADMSHGDFSTNVAMKLSKVCGEKPIRVAQNIVTELRATVDRLPEVSKIETVQPGFINFYLSPEYLLTETEEILEKKEKFGSSDKGKGKTIVIDYSHPNIAKPIGAHHLLTTLIGDSIKHIYASQGYKVIADNFLGDWGTQFGAVIYAYKNWGDKKTVDSDPIGELLKLYVKFHDEEEKDESLRDRAREEFKKLEDGDKENRALWKWMREESLKELKKIYTELNIEFDHYNGEAFYEDKMEEILEELKKKKVLKDGEAGAKIVDLEKENLPVALIQKGDGATLYVTRDLAAIKYRLKKYKPERILYVVEAKQELHLKQLFAVSKKVGYIKDEVEHVKFGTMKFPEGDMSTRKGKLIHLWDVLMQAEEKSLDVIKEKSPDLKDKEGIAKIVGRGAVKYSVLSQNRLRDVTFTWDKILSLDGNSAPYIMYTYARANSILDKSSSKGQGAGSKDFKIEKEESDLMRKLCLYPEVVERAATDYMPSHITTYVHELSQTFNTFYNKHSVLKAEKDVGGMRLDLVRTTAQVLENGMGLLNIELPKKM